MSTGSNDVDEIYNQMALIRRDRHTDVRQAVAGAEAIANWGRYSWIYPWAALGAAAAVGYLLYTSRYRKVTADTASPAGEAGAGEPVAGTRANGHERLATGHNLALAAWDIVFPVVVRAGQNYMLQWLEQHYPTKTGHGTTFAPSNGEHGGQVGSSAAVGH